MVFIQKVFPQTKDNIVCKKNDQSLKCILNFISSANRFYPKSISNDEIPPKHVKLSTKLIFTIADKAPRVNTKIFSTCVNNRLRGKLRGDENATFLSHFSFFLIFSPSLYTRNVSFYHQTDTRHP